MSSQIDISSQRKYISHDTQNTRTLYYINTMSVYYDLCTVFVDDGGNGHDYVYIHFSTYLICINGKNTGQYVDIWGKPTDQNI